MISADPTSWPADGARLLEPSISYALGVTLAVAGPSDRLAAFLGRSPGIAPVPGH
jgi:hypothetical protein